MYVMNTGLMLFHDSLDVAHDRRHGLRGVILGKEKTGESMAVLWAIKDTKTPGEEGERRERGGREEGERRGRGGGEEGERRGRGGGEKGREKEDERRWRGGGEERDGRRERRGERMGEKRAEKRGGRGKRRIRDIKGSLSTTDRQQQFAVSDNTAFRQFG